MSFFFNVFIMRLRALRFVMLLLRILELLSLNFIITILSGKDFLICETLTLSVRNVCNEREDDAFLTKRSVFRVKVVGHPLNLSSFVVVDTGSRKDLTQHWGPEHWADIAKVILHIAAGVILI